MKVLKFGGKSLANGKGLETVLSIIIDKVKQGQEIAVVVSARDKATDQLESMLERAAGGEDISDDFSAFKQYQLAGEDIDFSEEFSVLQRIFDGVSLLGDRQKSSGHGSVQPALGGPCDLQWSLPTSSHL